MHIAHRMINAPEPPTDPVIAAALASLAGIGFNYDNSHPELLDGRHGWIVDDGEAMLEPEPPGDPVPGGSFEAARAVLADCRFVDPRLLHAYYDPAAPLLGRDMLLRVRVGIVGRFLFGARITEVLDGRQGDDNIWGYSYRTLATHFEMGQIAFCVIKHRPSGNVRVRISRYSRLGPIANPFLRLGARVLTRPMQRRYMRYALRRIPEMVRETARAAMRPAGGSNKRAT
ncbi:MAG: DUF1990 family protein [Bacteroidetes bacterium]|nr:DUF1990 family protein [Bacteroidota bacterium]